MIITEKVGCLTARFSIVCRAGVFRSANDDTIQDGGRDRYAVPVAISLKDRMLCRLGSQMTDSCRAMHAQMNAKYSLPIHTRPLLRTI